MSDINNQQKFLVLAISGMVVIVTLAIIVLVIIWSPNKTTTTENTTTTPQNVVSKPGEYTLRSYSEKDVIQDYCMQIFSIFASNDKTNINNIVSDQYKQYRGFNSDQLLYALQQKGIIGKALQFYSYQVANNSRYGRVYEIEIGTLDTYAREKILLIEKSPRNYKLSFDNFIGADTTVKEIVRNGLKLTISDVTEFADKMYINCKLENATNSVIKINSKNAIEDAYVRLSNGSEAKTSTSWLNGEVQVMNPNTVVNIQLEFPIGHLQSGFVNTLILKDVYNDVTKETSDIEFNL